MSFIQRCMVECRTIDPNFDKHDEQMGCPTTIAMNVALELVKDEKFWKRNAFLRIHVIGVANVISIIRSIWNFQQHVWQSKGHVCLDRRMYRQAWKIIGGQSGIREVSISNVKRMLHAYSNRAFGYNSVPLLMQTFANGMDIDIDTYDIREAYLDMLFECYPHASIFSILEKVNSCRIHCVRVPVINMPLLEKQVLSGRFVVLIDWMNVILEFMGTKKWDSAYGFRYNFRTRYPYSEILHNMVLELIYADVHGLPID